MNFRYALTMTVWKSEGEGIWDTEGEGVMDTEFEDMLYNVVDSMFLNYSLLIIGIYAACVSCQCDRLWKVSSIAW